MPDTDRILEAEQSIQTIAAELKRMRDAANMLQDSQQGVDAVLKSAKKIIEVTEKFSQECGLIVTKLAATDLNQRLDGLQALHGEVAAVADSITKGLRDEAGKLQDGIQTASSQLTNALSTADERARSNFEQLAALIKDQNRVTNNATANIESELKAIKDQLQVATESAKKRQLVTIVVAILTFLSAMFLLFKALIPRLGG